MTVTAEFVDRDVVIFTHCFPPFSCRRLQREVDLLQRKMATLRRQAAADQPGGSAAAAEDSMAAAAAAGDVWGVDDTGRGPVGSRGRGTKTAIERDKALARLGLHVVEEFHRDVLVDIVQVCLTKRCGLFHRTDSPLAMCSAVCT
jgi:hypothetical protein